METSPTTVSSSSTSSSSNSNNKKNEQQQQQQEEEGGIYSDSHWQKYLNSLSRANMERITKIAESGIYEFEYVEGPRKGKKEIKKRGKISVRQMQELEKMRSKFTRLNKEESRKEAADLFTDIYAKCAKYYFDMDKDEFEITDWDTSRSNIDAAAHVSVFGRPK